MWRKLFHSRKKSAIHIAFGICELIHSSCMFCAAVLRAVDVETKAVGSDPAVTVLFALGTAAFWAATPLSLYTFVMLATAQAERGFKDAAFQRSTRRFRIQLPISAFISVLGCFIPLGMLTATSQEQYFGLGICHYLFCCITLVFGGLYSIPMVVGAIEKDIQTVVNLEMSRSKNLEMYKELLNKVRSFRTELVYQGIFNAIFAILFGGWPFLQRAGSSYWLPIAWFTACTVGFRNVYTLLPVGAVSGDGSSGQSSNKTISPKLPDAPSTSPTSLDPLASGLQIELGSYGGIESSSHNLES